MPRGPVISRLVLPILIFLAAPHSSPSAVRDYAVEAGASAQETPPRISLSWPADACPERYVVFRKSVEDSTWGAPVAILPGEATSFADGDVLVGEVYEYALRKSECSVRDTVQVDGGLSLTFAIRDSYGDGICCRHGLGSYEVVCDGAVVAEGGAFGSGDATSFAAGEPGGSASVLVNIELDVYAVETTWTLTEDSSGDTLAEGGPYEAPRFGHVLAGIKAPAIEQRGGCLLVVAPDAMAELPDEIARLETDLICDGYEVVRAVVPSGASVTDVKGIIVAARQADPALGTVFILGHVPVPYSGNIWSPHPEHKGAWPADLYYGELDGDWTDDTVNTTSAMRPENHNVPGDGKFDQTFLPSDVDLEVGRVDMHDLPSFSSDEYALLRQYLDKDHAYRRGGFIPDRRGLVDDNVGESLGTAPAALGWRYFTSTCGPGTVSEVDYLSTLSHDGYLWSYGVGGGSYSSCFGVARTSDFASVPVYTVFTALFGSYFGDWDSTDNLLRSALANEGWPLVSFWGGRPTWHLHRMALGRTIGHCARLTQNNDHLYTVADGGRQIVPALMGDPTLRLHVVEPPGDVAVEQAGPSMVTVTWAPSGEAIEGYHVYRAPGLRDAFERVNADVVADTSFTDTAPLEGNNVYMVRALKLETSGGGTYYNLSAGVVDSLSSGTGVPRPAAPALSFANPFPAGAYVRYRVPVGGDVNLRIFNAAGREVRRLVEGRRDGGWHVVAWDGRAAGGVCVASGVYFCRLEGEGWKATGKLVLVR